ncbi:MAG: hypothetical protein ACJ75T_02365 [Solirubrobacterales bacterium]
MAKARTRLTRTDRDDSEVIEESLRRDLGLDALAEIWARVKNPLSEKESLELAVSEVHEMRREMRAAGGS